MTDDRRARGAVVVGMIAAAAVAAASMRAGGSVRGADAAAAPPGAVRATPLGEYAGSSACLPCHPGEHASWKRTFHRTMTTAASADAIVAEPRDDLEGGAAFERDATGARVRLPGASGRGATARVLLTTGSHHMQGYWVAGERDGELRMFPFVWLLDERRWLARKDAFLQPADAPPHAVRWNSNCIACHAVGGRPAHDQASDRFATEVVELGVACEACHGPAGEHARRHRDPVDRYAAHARARAGGADPTIVNPARLRADRSSEVCGQCHAYAYPKDEDEWWTRGYTTTYRPGQPLAASRALLVSGLEGVFWTDGTVRVGGREYNGLALSKCHTRGELACTTCHSMHGHDGAEPDDQLRATDACARCHADRARAEHTRHAAGSPGASCVGCHMPRTSYALLGTMRSHRIDSPRAGGDRPNACNLCHLDRSLAWTDEHLAAWYGRSRGTALRPSDDDAREPAAVGWLMSGDAAQRAIVAADSAMPEAVAASGSDWQRPLLERLAAGDPYAAVRTVAARALRALPAASGPARALADEPAIARALARRDDRAVTISE